MNKMNSVTKLAVAGVLLKQAAEFPTPIADQAAEVRKAIVAQNAANTAGAQGMIDKANVPSTKTNPGAAEDHQGMGMVKEQSMNSMIKLAIAGAIMTAAKPLVGAGARMVSKQIPEIIKGMRSALPGVRNIYPEAVQHVSASGGGDSLAATGKMIMQEGREAMTAPKASLARNLQAESLRDFRKKNWMPMTGTSAQFGPRGQLLNPNDLAREAALAPTIRETLDSLSMNPMTKLSAAGYVMQLSHPEVFHKDAIIGAVARGAMPFLKAVGQDALSQVGRQWGAVGKGIGGAISGVTKKPGVAQTTADWFTRKGTQAADWGAGQLSKSRANILEATNPAVKNLRGRSVSDAQHAANMARTPGYKWTSRAAGAATLVPTTAAYMGLGAIPGVGNIAQTLINPAIDIPVGLAGKILDPGAEEGARRTMEGVTQQAPKMMQEVLSQMPLMQRLGYAANPQAFNQYLTPENIQRMIAQLRAQQAA